MVVATMCEGKKQFEFKLKRNSLYTIFVILITAIHIGGGWKMKKWDEHVNEKKKNGEEKNIGIENANSSHLLTLVCSFTRTQLF